MSEKERALEERVDHLERELETLQDDLRALKTSGEEEEPETAPVREKEPFEIGDWIEKVGIGLLLIGVIFFLNYSYEQGWFTELARVVIGAGIGAALLATGFRARSSNRHLSAVLMGGGIAVFYGVVYTAFMLYGFIPFPAAFILMQGITVAACLLAIRQRYSVLGSLAAIGAFATPMVLHDGMPPPAILAIYAALACVGMIVIYLVRRWRTLLFTTSVGAWALIAVAQSELTAASGFLDRGFVVAGIAIIAVATLFAPAISSRLRGRPFGEYESGHTLFSAVAAALALQAVLAEQIPVFIGFVAAVGGLVYFISRVDWGESEAIPRALRVSAAGFAAFAVAAVLNVDLYAQALLVIGVGANLMAREDYDGLRFVGVPAMAIFGFWSLTLHLDPVQGTPFFNPDGLKRIFAITGLVVVGLSFDSRDLRWAHFWASLVGGLAVIVHQLQDLSQAAMVSTCAWGALALSMLIYGMLKEHRAFQIMGLATIVATATKLLFFDLHAVDVVWRMVLFLAFGVTMLVLRAVVPTRGFESPDRPPQ